MLATKCYNFIIFSAHTQLYNHPMTNLRQLSMLRMTEGMDDCLYNCVLRDGGPVRPET